MAPRRTKAFIIHGHDDHARLELCHFLATLVGVEPVVLSEQPALGRTVIEQLEAHVKSCDVVVALLTRDDIALKDGTQAFRARQNVIFEIGFACAALGRERVCLLYQHGVEIPSDLSGVVYYGFSSSVVETQSPLIRHFQDLGLPILSGGKTAGSILVVDDDLAENSPLVQQLRNSLSQFGGIRLINDPDVALKLVAAGRCEGCIVDLVFRGSEMAGVRIAETALASGTPIVIMTGHRKEHLGLLLAELKRVNLSQEYVLTKPMTPRQYSIFLTRVRELLFGT